MKPVANRTALAATLALHLLLILLWQYTRHRPEPFGPDVSRIQWFNVMPERRRPSPLAPATAPVHAAARHVAASPPPAPLRKPVEATAPPAETPAPQPASPAPSGDLLQRARKELAGIDKDLKKEFPEARIKAPLDTPQARLEKGMDLANELAPPAWYEPAKIKEIKDAGGYSRRRYRVITSKGTYCVTYESNHAPDGIDTMQKGIKPKVTTCPINFDGTHDQW